MRYLCLGYLDASKFDALPAAERDAVMEACMDQCQVFRATGKVVAEESLQPARHAKTIRPRKGRPFVTDGPFAETKEQLGSFFIVAAASLEEAIDVASLHPAARLGEEYGFCIEVRPIQD